MRLFHQWQVAWTGKLSRSYGAAIASSTNGVAANGTFSINLEFLKKWIKIRDIRGIQSGRLEKMMVCATLSNVTSAIASNKLGEGRTQATGSMSGLGGKQCCVTKRACGTGFGTQLDEGCSLPPAELELPLLGY